MVRYIVYMDVTGRTIMPGLICTHSHIGGVGAADGSGPIRPGVRVYGWINVHDSGFRQALARIIHKIRSEWT